VSDVLAGVVDRLDAILRLGRGADGSLGADAQARALAVQHFRKGVEGLSLRDPNYPLGAYDRSYSLEWTAMESTEEFNGASSNFISTYNCNLLLGHLYGKGHSGLLKLLGSEVALTVCLQGTQRALSDATRVARALRFGPIHGADTDPVIVGIALGGTVQVEDLADRTITTIPLALTLLVSQTGYPL